MERQDALMILKILAILGGIFALLSMLARTAEASDTDGILSYTQCLKIEQMSGNPCVHKYPTFTTFGVGNNNGDWSIGYQSDGAFYRVPKNKVRYEMDGTPQQCANPCTVCKGSGCKYQVEADGTFTWVTADGNT